MAEIEDQNKSNEDLGLGVKVIEENRSRFINRDGSFNVHRKGVFKRGAFSPYHAVLSMSWPMFYSWILSVYVVGNLIFTGFYLLAGPHAFPQLAGLDLLHRVVKIFFYSVHASTPLGGGPLSPSTTVGEGILALEAVASLLGFTLAASLIFARFSNPSVKIIFSDKAVIAPYNGITGFMVRIINGRSNELIEAKASMTVSMTGPDGKRVFHRLHLERDRVLVFPLNWTIVHPIDEKSPLYNMSAEDLARADVEFVLGITAIDQDLSRTVHARTSYIYNEIVVGKKFVNILEHAENGSVVVDPHRIHEIEEVG